MFNWLGGAALGRINLIAHKLARRALRYHHICPYMAHEPVAGKAMVEVLLVDHQRPSMLRDPMQ